jgi:hypothetical protein
LTSIKLIVYLNVSLSIFNAKLPIELNDKSRYLRVGEIMIDAQIGSIKSFPKLLDDRLSDFKVKELLTTGTRELSLASFIPFKVIYSRGITVLGKFISDSA